jgi:hypothetical protein
MMGSKWFRWASLSRRILSSRPVYVPAELCELISALLSIEGPLLLRSEEESWIQKVESFLQFVTLWLILRH